MEAPGPATRALPDDAVGADRKRLCGRGEVERVLRHRPFFHRVDRLSGFTVQQEEIPIGPQRRERLSWLAIDLGVVQQRGNGDVGVPEIVMHDLVVPLQLAGPHVKGKDRRGVQVVPFARSPPNIGTALPVTK